MNVNELILARVGITREQVAQFFGIKVGPGPSGRPVQFRRRPVPPAVRREIRALRAAGKSQREIALATGIPQGTVWHIVRKS